MITFFCFYMPVSNLYTEEVALIGYSVDVKKVNPSVLLVVYII